VAEHERRIELAVDIDRAVEMLLVEFQRIVAAIDFSVSIVDLSPAWRKMGSPQESDGVGN